MLLRKIPQIDDQQNSTNEMLRILRASIAKRVSQRSLGSSDSVAILFSGGVDSTLIAGLCPTVLESGTRVDLINVAFETNHPEDRFFVPDRISCLKAYSELKRIYSSTPFRLILVNVSREEYRQHRSDIAKLMLPNNTQMDLSIATALWFASRCLGFDDEGRLVTSDSKTLLVGMGADELFGGYGRHRSAWERGGVPSLIEELQKDIDRIPYRNLGRDDRCIADNGREARFPFLDEDFMAFVLSMDIHQKMNFSLPRGEGDKIILRSILRDLGFSKDVYALPKRAIQFGAKTAKIDGKCQGTDRVD